MVRFGILGPVEALVGERRVAVGGPRQVALLAFLLVHANRAVSVDQLIDALWGEQHPAGALKRVQVAVARLRKQLGVDNAGGESPVRSTAGGYLLTVGPGQLDAEVFSARVEEGRGVLESGDAAHAADLLRDALSMWRGPPLAEVAYENFAQGEIRRLEELRLAAIEARVEADLEIGRHAAVIGELQALVAAHPTRERLVELLMLALYRCGRQADALEIYQQTRSYLTSELGLEPGPALTALEVQILGHDRALAPRGRAVRLEGSLPGEGNRVVQHERVSVSAARTGRRSGAVRGNPGSGTVAIGLLEREAEVAFVEGAFDRAAAGAGAVFLVEGAAGIGKSELLAVLRVRGGARGFGVLAARGSEFERDVAFGVARQLFEPMVHAASGTERRGLLSGVARVGARALGLVGGEPPADRFAAVHGLFWLCANRAERGPLVVVVDDVQWADDPSVGWLGYVARRAGDLALVLVVGLRSGDPGGGRRELGQLIDETGIRRLALAPLSAAAVGAIVRAELDADADESFCLACWELSGGNPLMVRELLVAARETGRSARGDSVPALRAIAPAAIGSSVLARLRRLGAEAVALARSLAVLGGGSEVIDAAALAGLDREDAELTADRLAAAQILAPVRPLEFFHPLIGDAVLADMAPGARRLAHRRAAALLEREGEGTAALVAAHLLACGPAGDAWVVERLRAAADEALDRGAPEAAASYARRAIAEPAPYGGRAALLLMLGIAERRAGQAEAIAHLEQALVAAGDDVNTLVATSFALAPALAESDRAERAVEVLERARQAPGVGDADLALTLEAGIAIVGLMNERTAAPASRRAEELLARVRAIADPPAYVLVVLAYYAARTNRADEAEELATRALRSQPYPPPREICIFLIVALTLIESYDTVRDLCNDLVEAARRRGAIQELAALFVFRASAFADIGALADAEADARWTLERSQGAHRLHAVSELIRVLLERDALEAAEQELEQCVDPRGSRSDEIVRFLIARGRLRVAQGRLSDALADFLECGQRSVSLGRGTLSALPWRAEAALMHAALGNEDGARRLADEQLQLAREFGRPRTLGVSLRACGMIEGGEGGLELLAEAVQTLERSQSPLELARAVTAHGAALRRAGRRVQARPELERALDLAHHCGAQRIAASARAELIVLGAKPRRDAATGRDALTAGELRVARLAADGLSNREIAQALFITAKTAKVHLSRVYQKLGLTNRGQLADALSVALEDRFEQTSAPAAIS